MNGLTPYSPLTATPPAPAPVAAPAAIAARPTYTCAKTTINIYSFLTVAILYGSANLGLGVDIGLLIMFLLTGVLANTIFVKDKFQEEFLPRASTSASPLPIVPVTRPRTCANLACCTLIFGAKLLFSSLGNISLYWASVSSVNNKFNNRDLTIAIAVLAIFGYLNESIISVWGTDTLKNTIKNYGQLFLAKCSSKYKPPYEFLYNRYAGLIALTKNPEALVPVSIDAESGLAVTKKVKDILAAAERQADLGNYERAYALLAPAMPNFTRSNIISALGLGLGAASGIAFSLNGAELILQALFELIKAVSGIQVDFGGNGYKVLANIANVFALGFGITYGWEGGEMILSFPERVLSRKELRDVLGCLIALAIPAFSCGAAVVQAQLSGNGMVMIVLGGLSPVLTNMTPTTIDAGYAAADGVIAGVTYACDKLKQCSIASAATFRHLTRGGAEGEYLPLTGGPATT